MEKSSQIRNIALSHGTGLGSNGPIDACHSIASLARLSFCIVDEPEELLIDPILQFKDLESRGCIHGDCDDVAMFVACLTYSLGIQTRFKAIQRCLDGSYGHVFVEVLLNDEWFPLDPTLRVGQRIEYHPADCIVEQL